VAWFSRHTDNVQSEQDAIYEQDILRDPRSVKPWLAYVEFKRQHGTLLEQAYVSRTPTFCATLTYLS
jgi:hypothetical protein